MIFAALGNIDGDARALESALAGIDAAGIQTIVHTGDCVGFGSAPNETLSLLRARAIPGVQGDMDRRVARFVRKQRTLRTECAPNVFSALQRTYDALHSEHVEYLAGLPRERRLVVDGITVYLCHGSPHGQDEGLLESDDANRFRRFREMARADIVVMGHTPHPFSRMCDGVLFVNPGFLAGECPCYAVVDTETEPWSAAFHRPGDRVSP